MIIRRRALLGMLGLAAVAAPAVSSVPIGSAVDNNDRYRGYCVVTWQDLDDALVYTITIKNLTTKELMTWTCKPPFKNQIKFMVKNPTHIHHVRVTALMKDGRKRHPGVLAMDFHDGDPLDMV